MLILATFATLALLIAGSFALLRGDTLLFVGILIVLCLLVLAGISQLSALLDIVQQTLDTTMPIASH